MNLPNYHVSGTMLEKCHELQPKPKTTDKLKVALQTIWDKLPQEHVDKAVANFTKCLTAYMAVAVDGGHANAGITTTTTNTTSNTTISSLLLYLLHYYNYYNYYYYYNRGCYNILDTPSFA